MLTRNWIIYNTHKASVYAFLKRNHITYEPSECGYHYTCIAAWNLTLQQAVDTESFIISNHFGYCMDREALPAVERA